MALHPFEDEDKSVEKAGKVDEAPSAPAVDPTPPPVPDAPTVDLKLDPEFDTQDGPVYIEPPFGDRYEVPTDGTFTVDQAQAEYLLDSPAVVEASA